MVCRILLCQQFFAITTHGDPWCNESLTARAHKTYFLSTWLNVHVSHATSLRPHVANPSFRPFGSAETLGNKSAASRSQIHRIEGPTCFCMVLGVGNMSSLSHSTAAQDHQAARYRTKCWIQDGGSAISSTTPPNDIVRPPLRCRVNISRATRRV